VSALGLVPRATPGGRLLGLARGVNILYISHRMRKVFENCDCVTVLRDGRHVKTTRQDETGQDETVGQDLAGVQRVKPNHDD
jgi:ABC-type sugar transport system ATPase subunit